MPPNQYLSHVQRVNYSQDERAGLFDVMLLLFTEVWVW